VFPYREDPHRAEGPWQGVPFRLYAMNRILVANIFGIGDVLFTTPLISSLKRKMPGLSVDYLCNARARGMVKFIPDVDDIYVYEKDDLASLWRSSKPACLKRSWEIFSALRDKKYDAVFDFTLSRKFGFFLMLAGIRRRIGLDYKKRGTFLTDKTAFTGFEQRHVIEHYLDLLEHAGVEPSVRELGLVPDENALERADRFLGEKGVGEGDLVAVMPGGGASWGPMAPRKRWSAGGFARVADILTEKGYKVLILGDRSETGLCEDTVRMMKEKCALVENGLEIEEYIAVLARCGLAVCNDGGPLHVAVALGLRTVSIFGPVDEKVYGPYPPSEKHVVMTAKELGCRPCYGRFRLPECSNDLRCLGNIEPGKVANACLKLLGRKDVYTDVK